MLLERDRELAGLSTVIDAACGGDGRLAIVQGEAGIGKTTLLATAAEAARTSGMCVLSARGSALERAFGFGVARQLLEPMVRRTAREGARDLLAGSAGAAAPVLGLAGAPAIDGGVAAYHGLYWLAANIAADRPTLLIVDDAHWSDEESLRWLAYLLPRLEGVALGVLLGWRTGEPDEPAQLHSELARAAATMSPQALSADAARLVIRKDLDEDADPAFCDACHQASGGNPFLLGELLETIRTGQLAPTVDAARRVRDLGPAAVTRSVLLRLLPLGEAATSLAHAVAVLDADAELRFAASIAGLDAEAAADAADRLVRAHILTGEDRLRFAHPVMRACVYDDLAPVRRAALHRKTAQVLHDDAGDPERAAIHLLATTPSGDAWVVERLLEAADLARDRGVPADAVLLVDRALREPPTPDQRTRAFVALATASLDAGHPDAEERLREAYDAARDDASLRAMVAGHLARALWFCGRPAEACEFLREALTEPEQDLGAADALALLEANIALASSEVPLDEVHDSMLRLSDRESGDPAVTLMATGLLAYERMMAGQLSADLCRRMLSGLETLAALAADPTRDHPSINWIAFVVLHLGVPDAGLFDAIVAGARARGALDGLASALACRAAWAESRGRLAAAESDARTAVHLAELTGQTVSLAFALARLIYVLVEQGQLDEADRLLAVHGWSAGDTGSTISQLDLRLARAELRLAQGDVGRARADVDAFLDAVRGRATPAVFRYRPVLFTNVLVADGDRESALVAACGNQAVADRHGMPGAGASASLARALAEEGENKLRSLEAAVAALEGTDNPLDLARAQLALGAELRRANRRREARPPLERAMEIAHRAGARPLAKAARQELAATGARPRRLVVTGMDALTASERRVAELAAAGHSNPEIAQTLFVSRSTIETHLSRVYTKLGIAGRVALAEVFSQPGPSPEPVVATAASGGDSDGVLVALLVVRMVQSDDVSQTRQRQLGQEHEAVVRSVLREHDGREVKSLGDGLVLTFASPGRAVKAALRIREGLLRRGIRTRAGIHAGEVAMHDGVPRASAIDVATAIASRAAVGEILVSSIVRDLMAQPPSFLDRGQQILEGLPGQVHMLALRPDG